MLAWKKLGQLHCNPVYLMIFFCKCARFHIGYHHAQIHYLCPAYTHSWFVAETSGSHKTQSVFLKILMKGTPWPIVGRSDESGSFVNGVLFVKWCYNAPFSFANGLPLECWTHGILRHLSRYGDSHDNDKTVMRPPNLCNDDPFTAKTTSLYWNYPWWLPVEHISNSTTTSAMCQLWWYNLIVIVCSFWP